MPNDGMNGVIWLPSLHQDVKNHQPKENKKQDEVKNDKSKKENENVMIVKQNKRGDKEMVTKMRRQAYKSKVHETFLAKHALHQRASTRVQKW